MQFSNFTKRKGETQKEAHMASLAKWCLMRPGGIWRQEQKAAHKYCPLSAQGDVFKIVPPGTFAL